MLRPTEHDFFFRGSLANSFGPGLLRNIEEHAVANSMDGAGLGAARS